jgi:glycosyltransferase involved in cell wall biosynthesis
MRLVVAAAPPDSDFDDDRILRPPLTMTSSSQSVLSQITPVILTLNEAPNLRRTLECLRWAYEVIVVDSFSTDETEEIARSFPSVVFVQRQFDNHATQWNFGCERVKTEWVLSLDADYILTEELQKEISQLRPDAAIAAYFARFRYCIFGRSLRASLYPPRAILFRRQRCRYVQQGHTQVLAIDGPSTFLDGWILHDDRKPLARWVESQRRYAELEAYKLTTHPEQCTSLTDRLRRWIWPATPAAFFYTLLVKRCLLDGWAGWYYVLQRTYYELLLSLELLERRLSARGTGPVKKPNSPINE